MFQTNDIMMKKALVIVLLLLYGTSLLHGQVADSVSWQGQGRPLFRTGTGIMAGGALTAAAGAGIMLYASSHGNNQPSQDEVVHENMGSLLVYILGACGVITGASLVIAGIPLTVAGHSMMGCDMPWRDARYDTRGLGVIVEGGYFLPDVIEARAALGYHFNSHIFLGGGIAPGFFLDGRSRDDSIPRLSLPVYADFRWSIRNRLFTPYLGLSAGMEMSEISPYLGAEIGTRIRTDRTSTRSFWGGLSGEVAGGYMRAGLKMGYSF